MKKVLTGCWAVFYLLLNTYSQPAQITTGSNLREEQWAVVEDTTQVQKRYVSIGNQQDLLWIASYDKNGTVLTSATATNYRKMIARDISLAPYDPVIGTTYYVTGWTEKDGNSRMFIGRINLNAKFVWYYENPFTKDNDPKEGVAIVTAYNGDVVAAGNSRPANSSDGYQVFLARFTPAGGLVWSNIYAQKGNWMVREIDLGKEASNCQPTSPGDNFIITGEAHKTPARPGPVTFAAAYTGDGKECWRNLYPAIPNPNFHLNITGDAGYDVVFEPETQAYCIAGVAETNGNIRASAGSTPYILKVAPDGSLVFSLVYIGGDSTVGAYPRSVALGHSDTFKIVLAGPSYVYNKVFRAGLPNFFVIDPNDPVPTMVGIFGYFTGLATANSYPQPFFLNDAQPEHILRITGGHLVSTNSWSDSAFGGGDGHFIRTTGELLPPATCRYIETPNKPVSAQKTINSSSQLQEDADWESIFIQPYLYPVEQQFCVDPACAVNAAFTFTVSGQTVHFTNTSTGDGTGILSYEWYFGDGGTSIFANPSHTFTGPGPYSVYLITTNTTYFGETCPDADGQTVTLCGIDADFKDTIQLCTKVAYTNLSTGAAPLSYSWLFDDGTTSASANPVKKYTACGEHTTRLIVCNANCCDTIIKTTVVPCCPPRVNFCLTSTGTSVLLDMGKSVPGSYKVFVNGVETSWFNNSAKVLAPGPNTVCVAEKIIYCDTTCCVTTCKTINVSDSFTLNSDPPCNIQARLKATYCTQAPLSVTFTNLSSGATSYQWDFGDPASGVNNTSTAVSPVHNFTAPGTYLVCLQALLNNNCWSKSCYRVIVSSATSNNSCEVLPSNPAYKFTHPLIKENTIVLVEQKSSGSKQRKEKFVVDNH